MSQEMQHFHVSLRQTAKRLQTGGQHKKGQAINNDEIHFTIYRTVIAHTCHIHKQQGWEPNTNTVAYHFSIYWRLSCKAISSHPFPGTSDVECSASSNVRGFISDRFYQYPHSNSCPPEMRGPKEPPEHKARRKALQKLEAQVINLKAMELAPSRLEDVNIRALPMSLDDSSSFKPCFFDPYRAASLSNPDPVRLESDFPDYDRPIGEGWVVSPIDGARVIEHYLELLSFDCQLEAEGNNALNPPFWTYKEYVPLLSPPVVNNSLLFALVPCLILLLRFLTLTTDSIAEHRFKPLFYDFGEDDREWQAMYILDIDRPGHEYPHLNCAMVYDVDRDDDHLLRGELLTIIRIMHGRMRWRCWVDHMVIPVSFLSPQPDSL